MERTDSPIQTYLQAHTEAESPLLAQIREETYAHVPMPQMLSGHLQGRVLAAFSHMIRPTCVLEVGTYTGYSTLCLAEGLQAGGLLYTIDKNADLEATVRRYFEQAGKAHQIQYHLGQAAMIIPQIEATFDLVFIDADKKNYLLYYELIIDRVRPGGFVIADNVLWSGRVVTTPGQSVDARTQAIIDFNAYVHKDTRVANVLLPIRDGLMVLRKR